MSRKSRWALLQYALTTAVLLCACGCSTPPRAFPAIDPPPEPVAAGHLYDEIVNAIEDGSFDAILSLQAGEVALSDATIVVAPDTQAHLEANIVNGRLREASLSLSHPVVVRNEEPYLVLALSAIAFDRFGRATVDDIDVIGPPLYKLLDDAVIPTARAKIERALRIDVYADSVLRGNVFADRGPDAPVTTATSRQVASTSSAHLAALGSLGGAGRDRLSESTPDTVQVPSVQDLIDGITIRIDNATLAAGSKFQFAEYDRHPDFGSQSRVFVGPESRINLPYVHLAFDRSSRDVREIEITGGDLFLTTIESTLVSASQTFKLGRESSLFLRGLDLHATRDASTRAWTWSFSTRGGIADVELAQSDLGVKGMWLRVGEGSSMTLREVRFSGRDGELLQVNGQGALRLTLDSGLVSLGPVLLAVGQGSVLDLEGIVKADSAVGEGLAGLDVQGRIAVLDLRIDDLVIDEDVTSFIAAIGRDADAINILPLADLGSPQLTYVRAGRGSRVVGRDLVFNSSESWNVDGSLELIDLRAVDGRLWLGDDSSIEFGLDSRVTMIGVVFDREQRSLAGKLGGTLNVTSGALRFGRGDMATNFPLASPSRVSIDPGAIAFGTASQGCVSGSVARITIATPPSRDGPPAILMLGRPVAVSGVAGLSTPAPSRFTLATGAAVDVTDLQLDGSGPVSASIEIEATVSEARLRIDERNGFIAARPFSARTVAPLRYVRGATAALTGQILANGVEVSAGILAPGESSRMSQITGRFEDLAFTFPGKGVVSGQLRGGALSFSGGEWLIGPTTLSLAEGLAENVDVIWADTGDARVTFAASLMDAGLELGGVARHRIADGIVITTEPLVSRLQLRDVESVFSGGRALESLDIREFSLVPESNASVLIEVDTQESRVFYRTTDDDGKPLDAPESLFGYNQHGIMGVRVWFLDAAPLSGPLTWSGGEFQRLPQIPERVLRVAFDSRNDHYDTGNKNAERVTLSGNTVKVDGNTKDKVHGQRERATRRVIVSSGRQESADYRVFIWNTAGAGHGFDPPMSRPADRPNPPNDLRIRLQAALAVRDGGIYLSISDFEWPHLEEKLHYDTWIDVDDGAEFWGGLANVVTNVFTLGQAGWDPVGKGIRDGRRDADRKLNAGFGTMIDGIIDHFESHPLVSSR